MVKTTLKASFEYVKILFKWLIIATVVGLVGGLVGSAFHKSIDYVTELRIHNSWLIFLLPVGGVIIALLYRLFKSKGNIDTDRVIESVSGDKNVPIIMVPLIYVSSVITHLLGGSAGREGAALQLGGGIGYNIGKLFRLKKNDMHIIVMSGMSSVFSALFGTPLTAAIFALEVASVGTIRYVGLIPCIISSLVSYEIALLLRISPVEFGGINFPQMSPEVLLKVMALAILCALVSILFCVAIKKCGQGMKKLISNDYLRAAIGAAMVVALTMFFGTYDYNGAGMDIITKALSGASKPEAFLLKIIFTAITISAGFKGGEIVPAFFVGSTFGCVAGALLGLDASFGAAIGFVALFCGVVNCPIASIFLAIEVFGGQSIIMFAVVCGISFMMSGYFGLYKSQKFVYSKLDEEKIDIYTK